MLPPGNVRCNPLCYTSIMNWFNDTETGRMVQSWIKVFLSTILSMLLADLLSPEGALDMTAFTTYLSAGVVAVLPLAINYLNPSYGRYGPSKVEADVETFDEEEYTGE